MTTEVDMLSLEPEPQSAPGETMETAQAAESTEQALARRIPWALAVIGCCILAAVLATWPLALNLTNAIPLGTEHEATVGLFSIWTLWWTANGLARGFAGYWDAPFFYPNAGVFTYSEPQPLTGLAVSPLWAVGVPPALILNVALLGTLALNGIFAYRLARALNVPRLGALAGGVLMVTMPFIAKVEGVLNLTPVFGILWVLDGLVRFGRSGSTRHAAWAAAGLVVAFLTCQQYTLMFVPFGVAAGLVALAQQKFQTRALVRLGSATVIAGIVILFVALPAISLHNELGLTRSDEVVRKLSAAPGDFVTRPEIAWVNIPSQSLEDTGGLFPGIVVLALAALAIAYGLGDMARRRWTLFFALSVPVAAFLAMGLNIGVAFFQPFDVLRALVPGFSELRSPFRFAVIMQLALIMLATMSFVHFLAIFRRFGGALIIFLGLAAVLENLALPMPMTTIPSSPNSAWADWVRAQPDVKVIAHIPFAGGLRVSDYEIDARRMFAQIDHQKPIVNGYSSYFPPNYTDFQLAMAVEFPRQDLLCTLNKGLDTDTLIVDRSWLDQYAPQLDSFKTFLDPIYSDTQVAIYHLHMNDTDCTSQGARVGTSASNLNTFNLGFTVRLQPTR
jgi:hypothetical protein